MTEHCVALVENDLDVYFDLQARYVRVKSRLAKHSGCIYGITWGSNGRGAIVREGEPLHPIWDIKPQDVRRLEKKHVRSYRLPRACRVSRDGTPVAYAPKDLNGALVVYLQDKPLSTMG